MTTATPPAPDRIFTYAQRSHPGPGVSISIEQGETRWGGDASRPIAKRIAREIRRSVSRARGGWLAWATRPKADHESGPICERAFDRAATIDVAGERPALGIVRIRFAGAGGTVDHEAVDAVEFTMKAGVAETLAWKIERSAGPKWLDW